MLEREIARIELCYPPQGFLSELGGALGAPAVEYHDGVYAASWPVMVKDETAGTYALRIQDPNVPLIVQATYFGLHPAAPGIELIAEMTPDGFRRRDWWQDITFPGIVREPVSASMELQLQPKPHPVSVATLPATSTACRLQIEHILEQLQF
jgi:hypothetical protein